MNRKLVCSNLKLNMTDLILKGYAEMVGLLTNQCTLWLHTSNTESTHTQQTEPNLA